jgi:hypothetical protein
LFPKTAIQKAFWLFVAISLYHVKTKSKNSFYRVKQILNLVLANREARQSAPSGTNFPAKTQWAALCATTKNLGKIQESCIVARLYDQVRTFFVENS